MPTKKQCLDILEEYRDDAEALDQLVREVNAWDGSLDWLEVHEFDDEFFSTYFEGKPEETARAVHFGDISNWLDDYVRFDGYGNLESLSQYDYDRELKESASEIIEAAADLLEAGNINLDNIPAVESKETEA